MTMGTRTWLRPPNQGPGAWRSQVFLGKHVDVRGAIRHRGGEITPARLTQQRMQVIRKLHMRSWSLRCRTLLRCSAPCQLGGGEVQDEAVVSAESVSHTTAGSSASTGTAVPMPTTAGVGRSFTSN